MKVKYTAKNFETAAEGMWWGETTEIKDLGEVDTPNGKREKVRFRFELDETDSQGRPLLVFATFNKTVHPQSRLAKFIYDLTGEEPGEEYELDDLLGIRAQLVLKHHRSETTGKVFANIAAILRPKTAQEEAEEKRVAAATAKVKSAATRPPASTAPPSSSSSFVEDKIVNEDIPF